MRHHPPAFDRADTRLLSDRLAAGIAASTRMSAALLRVGLPSGSATAAPPLRRRQAFEAFEPFDDANTDGPDPVAADPALRRALQARMEVHRQALLPGYEHRLLVEGRADADAWLRREARERGQREAEALRRADRGAH